MLFFWFAILLFIAVFVGSILLARSLAAASGNNRTATQPKASFPKAWHGLLAILGGSVLALSQAMSAGVIGIIDVQAQKNAFLIFLAGLFVGWVLFVWSQFNRRS
jgi:phosphate/sulfate permease